MKLNLNSKDVLNKNFSKNVKGYDAKEVDEFLDLVLADYRIIDDLVTNLNQEVAVLKKQNEELTLMIKNLQDEASKSSVKTFKVNDYSRLDNLDLLKKISAYELKLYELGVDPAKIK